MSRSLSNLRCRLRGSSSGCCASPEIPEDESTETQAGNKCKRARCGAPESAHGETCSCKKDQGTASEAGSQSR